MVWLTLSPYETSIYDCHDHCPPGPWSLVQVTATLENTVDSLRVRDPQAIFLRDSIGIRIQPRSTPGEKRTPSGPFQRAIFPYSSRKPFSTVFASPSSQYHWCPVPELVRCCHAACGGLRDTVYPRRILRSWDVSDRTTAITLVQNIGGCSSADC